MNITLKKTITLTLLGLGLLAVLIIFWQIPTQDPISAAFNQTSSIADYASSYSGVLSRPLFPEKSLFLPLILQVFISCILVAAMLITSMFFPKARHVVIIITLITTVRHLLWRGLETMDFSSPLSVFLTILIYGAELLAFFAMAVGYFQVWGQTEHQPVSLDDEPEEGLPTVDILVCTFNEPVNVLYRSLVGCTSIKYPNKRVYLCDDGNREEMRDLAEKLNVFYISREKNAYAKAGNLNHALSLTQSEYVLVFDADHVPCQTFLKETMGFFKDERMGFVQTPQHFFTADPFQRNLLASQQINNEQDLFFHVIQPGNDYWGSAFFAGSGALFRRAALESVGGFAVETITEDVHTGMRIHGRNWKSLYYNRDLAAGMAQDSFADVIKQRLRWARGMTQIYCLENPLFARGLSMAQRLCYFTGIWYFFHGLPRLIFMIAPLFFLLFGYKTINSGFVEVVIYYLPSFLATTLGYIIVSRGVRHSFWSEVYETAFCIYLSLTTFLTFLSPRNAKFRVTPKGGITERLSFNWRIVFPQVLVLTLTVIGIGMAIVRAVYTPEYAGGIYTNLLWSLYNLVLLLGAIYVAQERPQFRLNPRIFRKIRCELRLLDESIVVGHTTNISENGVAMVFDAPIPIAGPLLLKIMDWELNETTVLSVQAIRSSVDNQNHHYVGFQVLNRTDDQHQKLVRHMFGMADIWANDYVYTETPQSFWQLLLIPFRLSSAVEEALHRSSPRFNANLPCAIQVNDQMIPGLTREISETGMSLVLNESISLAVGKVIFVRIQWPNEEITDFKAVIKRFDSGHRGGPKISLAFADLDKIQRLELLQQIYQPKERLVRMAPSVAKWIPCVITSGEITVEGMSQAVSEVGVIVRLSSKTNLQIGQKVNLQMNWEDQSVKDYPAEIGSIGSDQGATILQLYFDGLNLSDLDQLSQHLHEPMKSHSFQTLLE